MELPIDHFRLLGVSATTDSQAVLNTLQQRLDRAPDQGFTHDTLQARADLLRSSAELLSDDHRRQAYERELTSIAANAGAGVAGLEIPPSREVGGLLLLMEAGQAYEAFEAASRGLQPPQAPALGSSREADLTLLAGIACMAAARDCRTQRRYEAAATTLQQGLQLLQRMGQLPDQRRQLEQELQTLEPYRVLDLLSRDLSAASARSEGIALLDRMVQRRGGLEGDADPDFPLTDFQPFFQQIRQFLTVQEQLDLFNRWSAAGWATSVTLSCRALTAAGFVQRKPERILAALERLESGGGYGHDLFMACQQLLLGQVEQAQALFDAGADTALHLWARSQGDDPLAGLCAYCRDWLSREVLPGFRDIEAEPDLEAWYADRDVQAFIEKQDRIRGRRLAAEPRSEPVPPPPLPPTEALPPLAEPEWPSFEGFDTGRFTVPPFDSGSYTPPSLESGAFAADLSAPAPAPADPFAPFAAPQDDPDAEESDDLWDAPPFWAGWNLRERLQLRRRRRRGEAEAEAESATAPAVRRRRWWLPAGIAVAVAAGGGGAWYLLRPELNRGRPIPVQPSSAPTLPKPPGSSGSPRPPALPAAAAAASLPLTVAEPDEAALRRLLEAWLQAKASVLAGRTVDRPLTDLARPLLISRLEEQKAEIASRGEVETMQVSLQTLEILERSPRRIAAAVSLTYSDERRDAAGQVVSQTPAAELRNRYVFARDGETWHVAAFRPGG